MARNWKTWLALELIVLAVAEGVGWLLHAQGWVGTGGVVRWLGRLAGAAWLFYGMFVWREVPWVARATRYVVTTVLVGLFVLLCRQFGWTGAMIAAVGAYGLAAAFVLGVMLIRWVLSPGFRVTAVARTLVDEALRMKIALIFIVALVLLLPILPLTTDVESMLKYRLQTFLAWSVMVTSVLLGLMTVFLAVGTITNEVHYRQIFVTLTKPLARWQYLLGKWLGIVLLDALLVVVCGAGIYVFTQVLAQQPARSAQDRQTVRDEILVARRSLSPEPGQATNLQEQFEQRLRNLRQQSPGEFGQPGDPVAQLPKQKRDQIQKTIISQWYTLDARETGTYVFRGLEEAKRLGGQVQFQLKPQAGGTTPDGFVRLQMRVNGRPYRRDLVKLSEDTFHVLPIPADVINEDGELRIALRNAVLRDASGREREQPSINFNPDDGLQVMYQVGTFEGNLTRSMILVWLHLCFLGMLGLAAGSFLGFPTASLLSLMVYAGGALTGYLRESLTYYSASPDEKMATFDKIVWVPSEIINKFSSGEVWAGIQIVVRMIGEGALWLIPSLSHYDPTARLSEGLIITWETVGSGFLFMGLIWTGIVALLGWILFHTRELARVTV